MTITKKKIDILDTARIYLDHKDAKLKVVLGYWDHHKYEMWIYIARKPHSRFKSWKKLQDYFCDIRDFDSIDQMVLSATTKVYNKYCEDNKDYLDHLKKWQEFIKNT